LKLSAESEIAQLAALKATADNYQISLKRAIEQQKVSAVSQATVDSDYASLKNAQALVDQQQAIVDQKTLKAPFAGRLGIRSVDIGQYLTAGTTIVTLQALDTLYVDLYLPQQVLSQIKVGQDVTTTVDAYPGKVFPGKITALNSKVDSTSRNVQIRATMQNPDGLLLPGMFGRVKISVGESKKFITLPQTAIVYNPYGDSVFIVDQNGQNDSKNGTVRQTFIKTGDTRGDNVAITSGVKEGEQVVIAGQVKLRNGSPVVIDNSHVPTAENAPEIKDQ
jgi:membrane fusion protein (multidrug efflux system)